MDEKNENRSLGGDFLNTVRTALDASDQHLLLPWTDAYPCVRAFVLNASAVNNGTLGGRIVLDRTPREIRVQLQLLDYGYVARWTDGDWDSALERIENDLDTGTAPWEPTFDQQKKDKQRRLLTK